MNEQQSGITKAGSDFGFDAPLGGENDKNALATQAGTASAMVRAQAEIQAGMMLARDNPRDERQSFTRLMRSCNRPSFAEKAAYAFPRGGTTVRGPSVYLARELARCWGNMRFGLQIVNDTGDDVHIRAEAMDLETNNVAYSEARFKKMIYRKKGGWQRPDERDLRELINRHGAIAIRNALLQIMPPDVIEEALKVAAETNEAAAKGEIEQDREQAVRRMAVAFNQIGVTVEMLTKYVGHELSLIVPKELAELREIYTSIKDGNSTVLDYFADEKPEPAAGKEGEPAKEEPPIQGQRRKMGP